MKRPVEIVTADKQILIRVTGLRTLLAMRRSAGTPLEPVFAALRKFGFEVKIQFGTKLSLELLPNPSALVRWFVPSL